MEKYEIHVINPFIYGLNTTPKGGFFPKRAIRFLDLQISKKKIFQKTILSLKFKFQAQDSYGHQAVQCKLNLLLKMHF